MLEDAGKNDAENSVEVDENQIKLAKEVEAAAKAEKAKLKKAKKKAKGDQGGAYFWRSRQEFELSCPFVF